MVKQLLYYPVLLFSASSGKMEKASCPFGKVLVRTRQRLGINQYQLAKRTGRSVQHLSQIEHGKSEPRISTVIMLVKALGVDIGDFVREVALELELEKPLT